MRPSVWHVSIHPLLIGKGHPTVRVCGSGMPMTVKVTESNKAKIFEIVRVPSGSDSSRQRQQIAGSNFIIGSDRTNSGSRQQAATSFIDVSGFQEFGFRLPQQPQRLSQVVHPPDTVVHTCLFQRHRKGFRDGRQQHTEDGRQ